MTTYPITTIQHRHVLEERFVVTLKGPIYCAPCSPGCVAPTGKHGVFSATGTIADIGRAYRAWRHVPTVSARGDLYPRRFIHGARPLNQIVDQIIQRHGGLWGDWCGLVARGLDEGD